MKKIPVQPTLLTATWALLPLVSLMLLAFAIGEHYGRGKADPMATTKGIERRNRNTTNTAATGGSRTVTSDKDSPKSERHDPFDTKNARLIAQVEFATEQLRFSSDIWHRGDHYWEIRRYPNESVEQAELTPIDRGRARMRFGIRNAQVLAWSDPNWMYVVYRNEVETRGPSGPIATMRRFKHLVGTLVINYGYGVRYRVEIFTDDKEYWEVRTFGDGEIERHSLTNLGDTYSGRKRSGGYFLLRDDNEHAYFIDRDSIDIYDSGGPIPPSAYQ